MWLLTLFLDQSIKKIIAYETIKEATDAKNKEHSFIQTEIREMNPGDEITF